MSKLNHSELKPLVGRLYEVVRDLEAMFPGRPFTPDGHLVGSLGEVLAADAYGLQLLPPSNQGYDALAPDGRQVEIKATQGTRVGFRSGPPYAIVIRLNKDGTFEEIYNGPGKPIWDVVVHKPMPKNGTHQVSLAKLKKLNNEVPMGQRIARVVSMIDAST